MKVWKLLSPKIFAEEERPDNIASPTQAKVKITKVLLAYPEIRAYTGASDIHYPHVPGMYAVGVVAETGSECIKVEKNTRVFLDGVAPCGECAECRKGNGSNCLSPKIAGIDKDGFLRDFIVTEEANLSPLPSSVSEDAALYAGIISLCENIVDKLDAPKGTPKPQLLTMQYRKGFLCHRLGCKTEFFHQLVCWCRGAKLIHRQHSSI